MNCTNIDKDHFVIPQWLPFKKAIAQRDLWSTSAALRAPVDLNNTENAFSEALTAFEKSPGPFLASDLLGTALRLGKLTIAKELAAYVLRSPMVGVTATGIAREVMGYATLLASPPIQLRQEIRKSKEWSRHFPCDAIGWIEQARLYTIIGQKRNAERAIALALKLAPYDRFVVRTAVRFFIHRGDWEQANQIAAIAAKVTNDPWLVSVWISTGTQLQKLPTKFKRLFSSALAANNELFHFSEMLEACATQELLAGSEKKAKQAFQQAWRKPPKTVVAHSQWIIREKIPNLGAITYVDFSQSAEAMAWVSLAQLQLTNSIQSLREWALEEPYSTRPFMLGSFIDTLREDYAEAESFAREGLRANPGHEGLTNNLAFSLLRQNQISQAASILQSLKCDFNKVTNPTMLATWGLLLMKQKMHAQGRIFYSKAIEEANRLNDPRLALRAVLNLFIAEVDTGGTIESKLLLSAAETLTKVTDASVVATAEHLNKRFLLNQLLITNPEEKNAYSAFDKAVKHSSNVLRSMKFQNKSLLQTR